MPNKCRCTNALFHIVDFLALTLTQLITSTTTSQFLVYNAVHSDF